MILSAALNPVVRRAICCIAGWLIVGCTENPFTNTETFQSHRTFSGQIQFNQSDTTQMPRAYIWMEALDFGTFSEIGGAFKLSLPSPSNQPGGGFTGSSNVYFYLANFSLDSIRVVMHKGELIFERGSLNNVGQVEEDIVLNQLFSVDISAEPAFFTSGFEDTLDVSVTLSAFADSQAIWTMAATTDDISSVLLWQVDSTSNDATFLRNLDATEQLRIIGETPVTWHGQFVIAPQLIDIGEYRVLPHLWVDGHRPPDALIRKLGTTFRAYDESFRFLPFLRNGGKLTILEPK